MLHTLPSPLIFHNSQVASNSPANTKESSYPNKEEPRQSQTTTIDQRKNGIQRHKHNGHNAYGDVDHKAALSLTRPSPLQLLWPVFPTPPATSVCRSRQPPASGYQYKFPVAKLKCEPVRRVACDTRTNQGNTHNSRRNTYQQLCAASMQTATTPAQLAAHDSDERATECRSFAC